MQAPRPTPPLPSCHHCHTYLPLYALCYLHWLRTCTTGCDPLPPRLPLRAHRCCLARAAAHHLDLARVALLPLPTACGSRFQFYHFHAFGLATDISHHLAPCLLPLLSIPCPSYTLSHRLACHTSTPGAHGFVGSGLYHTHFRVPATHARAVHTPLPPHRCQLPLHPFTVRRQTILYRFLPFSHVSSWDWTSAALPQLWDDGLTAYLWT